MSRIRQGAAILGISALAVTGCSSHHAETPRRTGAAMDASTYSRSPERNKRVGEAAQRFANWLIAASQDPHGSLGYTETNCNGGLCILNHGPQMGGSQIVAAADVEVAPNGYLYSEGVTFIEGDRNTGNSTQHKECVVSVALNPIDNAWVTSAANSSASNVSRKLSSDMSTVEEVKDLDDRALACIEDLMRR